MRFTMRVKPVTAAVICVLAVTTGCGSPDYIGTEPSQGAQVSSEQFNQLMQRPTLDEAAARYEEMRTKIKDRIRADLGLPEWQDGGAPSTLSCAREFPEVDEHDAGSKQLVNLVAPAPIPAERWADVKQILTTVGAEYGFTKVSLDIAKPPYFDFKITDQHKAELSIATNIHTVLALLTGCHLYTEAKQRGMPAVTPTY